MSRFVPRRALVAFAFLFAGLVTAPAAWGSSEQDFPVGGAEFQRAFGIAKAHWGTAPCRGKVTFTWAGLEPQTNARATWSNPTDAWNNPRANFDCSIVFNTLTQYDFPMLCTVMAHELGHLLGRQHEEAEGQLMSPIYSTPLPECGGAPAPAADAHVHAEESDDPIAWSVTKKAKARKKKARSGKQKARSGKHKARSGKRRRCVVRSRAGKRVRRCVTLKHRSAPKARTRVVRRYRAR